MLKWFEQTDSQKANIISSRIRLARNLDDYSFPSKLSESEASKLIDRLEYGLKDIQSLDGKKYGFFNLEEISELDRLALRDRRILNQMTAKQKAPAGLMLSAEEDTSIVLNGSDHIRIQVFSRGLHLEELLKRADRIDDYINTRFSYAFDKKYGYLTSYPTNVGTGLRASVLLHLPSLASSRQFSSLAADMGRFGTSMKSIYGEGNENYGSLYEISNQKTLGRSEREIIELVSKVANQLNHQEQSARELSLKEHGVDRKDEAYKSYGILKYARRLTMKEAVCLLSQVMAGITDGILKPAKSCSIYSLMLGIQQASLQKISDRPLGKEELDIVRAEYIRMELPDLI